jgi:hypothetical protein
MIGQIVIEFSQIFQQLNEYFIVFIAKLLRISGGLSVFGFIANKYKRIAIWSLMTIRNIGSGIQ